MTIMRQPSLFSIQELYEMEPTPKYGAIYYEISKTSHLSAPTKLNCTEMKISVYIHYIERIPTIKDLVKCLYHDTTLKINCGFLIYDEIPSKSILFSTLNKVK